MALIVSKLFRFKCRSIDLNFFTVVYVNVKYVGAISTPTRRDMVVLSLSYIRCNSNIRLLVAKITQLKIQYIHAITMGIRLDIP